MHHSFTTYVDISTTSSGPEYVHTSQYVHGPPDSVHAELQLESPHRTLFERRWPRNAPDKKLCNQVCPPNALVWPRHSATKSILPFVDGRNAGSSPCTPISPPWRSQQLGRYRQQMATATCCVAQISARPLRRPPHTSSKRGTSMPSGGRTVQQLF